LEKFAQKYNIFTKFFVARVEFEQIRDTSSKFSGKDVCLQPVSLLSGGTLHSPTQLLWSSCKQILGIISFNWDILNAVLGKTMDNF
jgi:hypothetical protein